MSPDNDDKTDFGFEKVSFQEKTKRVAEVFHSVANHYDLMNDMMSLGVHRLWKRLAIELASVRPNDYILDLAAGTGDLSIKMASFLSETGKLFVTDVNESMLQIAKERMITKGLINNAYFLQVNAEKIPFPDNTFDLVTIGFGLRNVSQKETALKSIYQALKPGGKLIILEFSKPTIPLLGKAYDLYSFKALPLLGKFIAKDEASYRYLAESIRMHPNQSKLLGMMEEAGFQNCSYHNLTGGIVAIHRGYKID
jgi:demethylmenaquinone methyltransferase/2-methoxy-6-polyprenyl-1,4-benzoquinol methylase